MDIAMKQVCVPVATVWTSPESVRDIVDQAATANPVRLDEWLLLMEGHEQLNLCTDNRIQTQALFGEKVMVVEEQDGWSSVILPEQSTSKHADGYPGWIPSRQLTEVEEDKRHLGNVMVTGKKALLELEEQKLSLVLSYLTTLPLKEREGEHVWVHTPLGSGYLHTADCTVIESDDQPSKGSGADILKSARQFLDLPYLWGGMSSYGYDCSGFAYSMHKANGYLIPRDAGDQAKEGEQVDLENLLPGDLLFFAYDEGKGAIHHVGIYAGEGKMIHSPKTGESIEITMLEGKVYQKELCEARRYWTMQGEKG